MPTSATRRRRHPTWSAIGAFSALLAGIVLLNLWPREPVPPRLGQVSAVVLPMQVVASGPNRDAGNMQRLYLLAIEGARRSIDLEAAYFGPDELIGRALLEAMGHGVRVRLVVPGPHTDSLIVLAASRAGWGAMLRAGAHVYRYESALFHNELMVVDGYLTIAGSANFDNRSFTLNDEANIDVYDAAFAAHMTQVIEADIQRSRELSLQAWRTRPWWQRLLDWCAAQAAAQL